MSPKSALMVQRAAWIAACITPIVVDCLSELGQHHIDTQQAGGGNNLVSDILLNAYVSYNAF